MELPSKIKDAINSAMEVQEELASLRRATDDKQILFIAHQIRAKLRIRDDIGFNIEKALIESEHGTN